MKYTQCVNCHNAFTVANVFTKEGWAETQISGFCETCFDGIFADAEDAEEINPNEPDF